MASRGGSISGCGTVSQRMSPLSCHARAFMEPLHLPWRHNRSFRPWFPGMYGFACDWWERRQGAEARVPGVLYERHQPPLGRVHAHRRPRCPRCRPPSHSRHWPGAGRPSQRGQRPRPRRDVLRLRCISAGSGKERPAASSGRCSKVPPTSPSSPRSTSPTWWKASALFCDMPTPVDDLPDEPSEKRKRAPSGTKNRHAPPAEALT